MKVLAYALTCYCLAAIIAAAVAGVLLGLELARYRAALPAAEVARAETTQAQQTAHRDYTGLAEQQHKERGDYSGADAIRMSYRVQQAQEAFRLANAKAQSAAEVLDELQQRITRRQLLYVPLGGILLLHVLGLIIFWPWRERKARKPAH